MLTLRPLREQDRKEITNWPSYPGDMEQMDYALRERGWLDEFRDSPQTRLFAAEDGEGLAGFTILAETGPAEAEFRIALHPIRTGRGLGGPMTIATLQSGFFEQRLRRIHLVVRKNNHRGIRLYRRLGFEDAGECMKEIQGKPVAFWKMEITQAAFVRLHRDERRSVMAKRALLVIDVQNDYVGGNLPIEFPPVEVSLVNIGRAMDAAKEAGIPVVAVHNVLPEGAPIFAKGTHGAELHQVVVSRGWDHYVQKNMPGAFTNTGLEEWLRGQGVDTVTIVGYMTHNCDMSTVVQALHAGFSVELLSDATGSLPYTNRAGRATAEEIHRVMTVVMQARFAAVMTTTEWLDLVRTGGEPERDNIFASNRRARREN